MTEYLLQQLDRVDDLRREFTDPQHLLVLPGRPHGTPGYYLRIIDLGQVVTMTLTPPQMSSLVEMIEKRVADATDGTGIDTPTPSGDAFKPLPEPPNPIAIHLPVEYISLNHQYADVILRFQAVSRSG